MLDPGGTTATDQALVQGLAAALGIPHERVHAIRGGRDLVTITTHAT